MLAEAFVNIGRYPSLAEVEIQLLELDAFGCGLTKQRERAAAGIVVGILFEVIFDPFGFGDDIPCREPFADFIPLDHRIVENASAQLVGQLLPGTRCERLHIGKLHPSELVERGGQRFGRRIDVLELVRIERYGASEDVGELFSAFDEAFEPQHLPPAGIVQDEGGILLLVQIAQQSREVLVTSVEFAP